MDGAAETEATAQRNTDAFDEVQLIPRCLVDVTSINTSTRILGQDLEWLVFCSPTGLSRLFHPQGELAVARAAARGGTLYGVATGAAYSLEDIAAASRSGGGGQSNRRFDHLERRARDQGTMGWSLCAQRNHVGRGCTPRGRCWRDGYLISNHGGRQLDGAAAPIDVLPEIARAVGDRIEIILDGGIRRGVHVLKALACGAKACSIGRPYLYGLAAGGEAGVVKALGILRSELVLAMQLAGCADVAGIDESWIRRASGPAV